VIRTSRSGLLWAWRGTMPRSGRKPLGNARSGPSRGDRRRSWCARHTSRHHPYVGGRRPHRSHRRPVDAPQIRL